ISQTLLQWTLLLSVWLLFRPSWSEEFRILHDIISKLVEMLNDSWQTFVTGDEIGHETADSVAHRIIPELLQLLQRSGIKIVDLFPRFVKRRSDGVSTLIVFLLHARWKRIEFFLTYRLTINDGDYCDTQLGHPHSVAVHLRLFVYIAENLVAFRDSLLRNAISSRDELFVLEYGG